jgi:hypothetical protein
MQILLVLPVTGLRSARDAGNEAEISDDILISIQISEPSKRNEALIFVIIRRRKRSLESAPRLNVLRREKYIIAGPA